MSVRACVGVLLEVLDEVGLLLGGQQGWQARPPVELEQALARLHVQLLALEGPDVEPVLHLSTSHAGGHVATCSAHIHGC